MLSASKGANVPYYFILLLNVLDDLLNLLFCSSFAITEDGHTICGRNLDYDIFTDLMAHLNTVFVYKPKEGYPFLSLAWPGYVGCLTGMNANGLVLTSHASYSLDKNRKGVPTGLLYRHALQHALSINDIERAITSAPRSIGNNVLLASDNEAFVLELSAKNWKKTMKSIQAPFISKPPSSSLPDDFFSYNHSIFRDEQLRESCKKEPFLVNEAIEALRGEWVANEATVQSVFG
jgi:hypothetical protein